MKCGLKISSIWETEWHLKINGLKSRAKCMNLQIKRLFQLTKRKQIYGNNFWINGRKQFYSLSVIHSNRSMLSVTNVFISAIYNNKKHFLGPLSKHSKQLPVQVFVFPPVSWSGLAPKNAILAADASASLPLSSLRCLFRLEYVQVYFSR